MSIRHRQQWLPGGPLQLTLSCWDHVPSQKHVGLGWETAGYRDGRTEHGGLPQTNPHSPGK